MHTRADEKCFWYKGGTSAMSYPHFHSLSTSLQTNVDKNLIVPHRKGSWLLRHENLSSKCYRSLSERARTSHMAEKLFLELSAVRLNLHFTFQNKCNQKKKKKTGLSSHCLRLTCHQRQVTEMCRLGGVLSEICSYSLPVCGKVFYVRVGTDAWRGFWLCGNWFADPNAYRPLR